MVTLLFCLLSILPIGASALTIDFAKGTAMNVQVIQMFATLAFISLAPMLLLMMTSFTRIAIALAFVKQGMGVPGMPPGGALSAIAFFLTLFIMSSPIEQAYNNGIKPFIEEKIKEDKAIEEIAVPFHAFMAKNVKEKDLELFCNLSRTKPKSLKEVPMKILIPSFMLSEIKRGFEMGFLILVPFLIIDIVVSVMLVSLGMMMMPPVAIALPLKVVLFTLVDGWGMLFGSLVRSFGPN